MSANRIKTYTAGGYNFYTVATEGKTFAIGGVPEKYSDDYIKVAVLCDAAVLLTSKPEFNGGLDGLLRVKPDIEIYGGSAALRNIKAILNRRINEKLIKDNMDICGIRFMVMPNLHWVDTVMAVCGGVLFSGEAFSGLDCSGAGLKDYFDARLAVNKPYVRLMLERLESEKISTICPAYGMCMRSDLKNAEDGVLREPTDHSVHAESETTETVFRKYHEWSEKTERGVSSAAIVYSSEYGYTKELAMHAAQRLSGYCAVNIYNAKTDAELDIIRGVNEADMLVIGTNTINRNAPCEIWRVVTGLDLMNKKGTPYFVFGSFGWAGDGIRLIDKTLTAMGLRAASKPVDVLFRPSDEDMERIDKAVERIIDHDNEGRKNR